MTITLLLLAAQANPPLDLPKDVRDAFAKAESFTLYSLDPIRGEGFHGYPILGQTELKGDLAKAAREALHAGAKESDGKMAKCFEPRHGVRVGDIDLVICFACLRTYVYRGEKRIDDYTTTATPAKVLNKILSDAGVPLPKR